jgi:arylsulfatase A-like enzyme
MPTIAALRASVVIGTAAVLVAACGFDARDLLGGKRPSFVLVVVDTLRADRLHYAGYERSHSPNFDALKQESVSFSRAFATAPWTLPSLASLFSSQLGSQHRAVMWGSVLTEQSTTLAEILRDAGYRTAGFTANVLIDKKTGLAQGFDAYQVVLDPLAFKPWERGPMFPNASADAVNSHGLDWLRRIRSETSEAPFFLYLHYMEPHTPYRCPGKDDRGCKMLAAILSQKLHAEEWDFDATQRKMIHRLYDAEVQATDARLGNLLVALRGEGFWGDTWFLVTADHGELLGEGGAYLHGKSLEREELHVPLLISGPSRESVTVDEPVSLLDVGPTILDLAGVDAPSSFHGRSLRPLLEGRDREGTPVVAEAFHHTETPPRHRLAVIDGTRKIVMEPSGRLQRFDLEQDPGEERPLLATPAELSAMLGEVEELLDFSPPRPPEGELAPETQDLLEALGYAR